MYIWTYYGHITEPCFAISEMSIDYSVVLCFVLGCICYHNNYPFDVIVPAEN